ncbi:PAS domain S-box-containing protein/diguanylate cyclase (GGDEF)-like protein [Thiobaca trueperi]|uniref:PAS domain S-box-containing protein/diguanylate cyclase (GGDEF)-like protein n=2 Tax=Thiobaca trueperi TaxID=127458 RepID=A0A4R3MVS7_9GAMM|nr:PAS domain S-box-containing protein/diguanylate cyclase (GGDEF)-like protein [Thiobaca trueperi]
MSKAKQPECQEGDTIKGQQFAIELVHQLVVPTFVLDAECRVIVWNRACEQLTGMPAADVIGTREHWRAFYSKPRPCLADLVAQERMDEIDRFYVAHESLPDTMRDAQAENWCVMPLLGTERYLALDAAPIRDAAGRLIAVVETLRDMTDRKLAERRLRLIASVFEHSQEGIVITDPAARILDVNGAFTRVTGYSREEVLGQTPALLKSDLQDATFYQDMWQRLNETGQWQGEVWNRKKSGELYPEILHINAVSKGNEITHYIGMFLDITDLKNTQQRLENLANYDSLTGLPNRVLLADRLHQALANAKRHNQLVAICFLDLDDFKLVNDQYGHETGDHFLIEIAQRLLGTIRVNDTVARLGGDEFVLLITDLEHPDELNAILGRICDSIARPFQLGDIALGVSVSIGVTLYPLDDSDPDTLLRHADQSMYQAKQSGRNRYHVFDLQAANAILVRHRELERIRQALQHGEFRLYYQPKVNMRTGEVVGMEALIRWQHPEHGIVPPLEFLPLIENSPLIVEIGEWVLHEALEQMDQWAAAGRPVAVSVNISAHHFQHIDFVARLRAILNEHPDVSPHLLELEILESAALSDIRMMRGVIAACQLMGVTFALDDFGTGYSSLSYLKQLPAETLKIDQSFVRDMLDDQEDLAIIEGVIGLANVFKKHVIAEGVETPEHGLLLMRFGCDYAQGYGISRPMPGNQVPDWIKRFKPDSKWDTWANDQQGHRLDTPLILAQYDHIKWVRRIVEAVEEPGADLTIENLGNPEGCRFGVWYHNEGRARYGHLPEHAEVGATHCSIHRIGAEVIDLRARGDLEAARVKCEELLALKATMLNQLDRLQRSAAAGADAL